MLDQQTVLEIFKASLPLVGAVIGASAALFGGFLSDRRKAKQETRNAAQREKSLLTGMYVVRNHIAQRLSEYEASGLTSALQPLRSAHRYVDKLIDKTPPQGEALLMGVIEVGLKLDAVLSIVDRRANEPAFNDQIAFARAVTGAVDELLASLEQFDVVAHSSLSFLDNADLERIIQASRSGDEPQSGDSPVAKPDGNENQPKGS